MKYLFGLLIFSFLTGCATHHYYKPAESNDKYAYGYRDQKLDETKYRISFNGSSSTPRETVELYLLYRAAEITTQNGYEFFKMISEDTDANERSNNSSVFSSIGFGGRRSGFGLGYGVGVGPSAPSNIEAVSVITLYKEKPAGADNVYNAKEIMVNLASKIEREEKKK